MSEPTRPMPASVRLLLALVGLALVLTGVVGGAAAGAAPLRQQEGDDGAAEPVAPADPLDALADCVVEKGRLQVLLLVDESDSVRINDPEDQRVAGALTALDSLDRLTGTDAEGGEIEIDVLVSTFASEFTPIGDWTPLDEDSRDDLRTEIEGLADQEFAKDSDFHNGLVGAQQAMAEHAAELSEDGTEPCQVLLMFADGDYLLDTRSTPEEQEELGVTKDYAPGIELTTDEAVAEAIELGTEALCEPDGVVDQMRDAGTTIVALELGDGSDLLEAIATGSSEGQTCGDPDTDLPGVYLAVSDTDDLIATFDLVASRIAGGEGGEGEEIVPCVDEVCSDGSVPFVVEDTMRGVHILVTGPTTEMRVALEPPEGDPLEVSPGEDVPAGEVGGVPVEARWVAERSVTIDIELPDEGDGVGTWRVVLIGEEGDEPGLIQVVTLDRGVDQAKRIVLAVVLMAIGLLAPLALLVLINVATTRFQDLSNVRGARVPVVVTGHGQILRTDGGLHVLRLPEADFEDLEGLGEHRQFTWRGLVFQAATPLNPFAEPHATVAPEGGTAKVAKEARRTDLALGLAGSWMFLLDQDATRAADRADEIHGQLVAFVAAGSEAAQTHRLILDVEDRLPATARRLARIADVRGGQTVGA